MQLTQYALRWSITIYEPCQRSKLFTCTTEALKPKVWNQRFYSNQVIAVHAFSISCFPDQENILTQSGGFWHDYFQGARRGPNSSDTSTWNNRNLWPVVYTTSVDGVLTSSGKHYDTWAAQSIQTSDILAILLNKASWKITDGIADQAVHISRAPPSGYLLTRI